MSRNTSGLWRGGPGRPRGVPNRATREARAFLQGVLQDAMRDPGFRGSLVHAIVTLELDPKVLRLIFEYAYGKAPQAIEVTGGGASFAAIVSGKVLEEPLDEDDDEAPMETIQ